MFIFILLTSVAISELNTIYIPLCLYLYEIDAYPASAGKDLHSTMFIFIYQTADYESLLLQIYIPLCLYLYPGRRFHGERYSKIYIPLCLYLYGNSFRDLFGHSEIYIPLCLYLYFTPPPLSENKNNVKFTFHYVYIYISRPFPSSACFSDLHSTMFIFIFSRSCGFLLLFHHLHSTMFIFI